MWWHVTEELEGALKSRPRTWEQHQGMCEVRECVRERVKQWDTGKESGSPCNAAAAASTPTLHNVPDAFQIPTVAAYTVRFYASVSQPLGCGSIIDDLSNDDVSDAAIDATDATSGSSRIWRPCLLSNKTGLILLWSWPSEANMSCNWRSSCCSACVRGRVGGRRAGWVKLEASLVGASPEGLRELEWEILRKGGEGWARFKGRKV